MRLILNVISLVFGGPWPAVGYLPAALAGFLVIVTIPLAFSAPHIANRKLIPLSLVPLPPVPRPAVPA
jgi:uncharacterized membrane protein YccF (DUF307 family)